MIYLAHFHACVWHAIGSSKEGWEDLDSVDKNWISELQANEEGFARGSRNDSVSDRYVASLYWAITTMSTVGYGDIIPCNTTERIFAISAMVTACGMFAMIIGSMQNVLSKFGEERMEFDRMLVRTMRYLRSQKVPTSLSQKVKGFLEHSFE